VIDGGALEMPRIRFGRKGPRYGLVSGYIDRLVFDGFEEGASSLQTRREEGHVG
jgi:hypothetical protein